MATALHRRLALRPASSNYTSRPFSSTTALPSSLQIYRNDPTLTADTVPAYPYGAARWYKQSNLGLYGGARKQFGNNVSGRFDTKTRRTWNVNIMNRRLFSRALDRLVQVRVSSRVLRTIDKVGGLDEYLLGEKEARIRELGVSGWWLRWAIMQTEKVKKQFATERQALGLAVGGQVGGEGPQSAGSGVEFVTEPVREAREEVDETVREAEEHGLVTEADDAFVPEVAAGLPALKFRIGPGQHLVLTSKGWRRTRPNPQRAVEQAKKRIRERYYDEQLVRRAELMEREVEKLAPERGGRQDDATKAERGFLELEAEVFGLKGGEVGKPVGLKARMKVWEEKKRLLAQLKARDRKVVEERVEATYAARMAAKEEGKRVRRREKEEKKRAMEALVEEA